ncbi:MAG: hypothetical protein OXH50_03360 [Gemmatimonadetes bacterium]|nr:hypothetical protein [Gemmatimonadota bacterium]
MAGISHEVGASMVNEIALAPDSQLAIRQRARAGPAEGQDAYVSLEGSGIFLPVEDWDRDDYYFRGLVRGVAAFDGWLGQSGWNVRVGVMQFGDESADLDVFVTERVWDGDEPPRVGQDIEGRLVAEPAMVCRVT